MTIENCTLETIIKYVDASGEVTTDYYRKEVAVDYLQIKVPLPGGTATYEIRLEKGVRESLELASQLVKSKL